MEGRDPTEVESASNEDLEQGSDLDSQEQGEKDKEEEGTPPRLVPPRDVVPAFLFLNVIDAPPPVCTDEACGSNLMEDDIGPLIELYGFGAVSTRDVLRAAAAVSREAAEAKQQKAGTGEGEGGAKASSGTGNENGTSKEVSGEAKAKAAKEALEDMTRKS